MRATGGRVALAARLRSELRRGSPKRPAGAKAAAGLARRAETYSVANTLVGAGNGTDPRLVGRTVIPAKRRRVERGRFCIGYASADGKNTHFKRHHVAIFCSSPHPARALRVHASCPHPMSRKNVPPRCFASRTIPIVCGGVATRFSSTRFIRPTPRSALSLRLRPGGSNLIRSADVIG